VDFDALKQRFKRGRKRIELDRLKSFLADNEGMLWEQ
jgi:hypothetical protein